MGLENPKPATWISTFGGVFTTKANEGQEGAMKRTTKTGNVVWYHPHRAISGFITSVRKQEKEWEGKKLVSLLITFEDDGKDYILTLPWKSNAASRFFICMENIDFKQKIRCEIATYNDKQYLFFKYNNNDTNIPAKYTKDNPNGKPEWEWVEIDGEKKPNRTKELAFFENILTTVVQPKIQKATWGQGSGIVDTPMDNPYATVDTSSGDVPISDGFEDDDDLPF